jgi:lipopolysaccharide/colanic/teichoic acid biosynthesis glycosyltransferase
MSFWAKSEKTLLAPSHLNPPRRPFFLEKRILTYKNRSKTEEKQQKRAKKKRTAFSRWHKRVCMYVCLCMSLFVFVCVCLSLFVIVCVCVV